MTEETCKCGAKLYVKSIIPQNGQVNVQCSDEECECIGFIFKGKLYLECDEDYTDATNRANNPL